MLLKTGLWKLRNCRRTKIGLPSFGMNCDFRDETILLLFGSPGPLKIIIMWRCNSPNFALHWNPRLSSRIFLKKIVSVQIALAAWYSGIVSPCHRGDRSFRSWDRIPPGYWVVAFKKLYLLHELPKTRRLKNSVPTLHNLVVNILQCINKFKNCLRHRDKLLYLQMNYIIIQITFKSVPNVHYTYLCLKMSSHLCTYSMYIMSLEIFKIIFGKCLYFTF
jgi:hypothetical protein